MPGTPLWVLKTLCSIASESFMVHVLSEVSGYGFEGCKAGKGSTVSPGCDASSHSEHSGKDGGDAWASSMHPHFPRLIYLLVIPFQWKKKGLRLKIATVEQRPALSPQYGTIP